MPSSYFCDSDRTFNDAKHLVSTFHWVAFQSADMGSLLTGVEAFMSSSGFAVYAKDAHEFRRVEGRYISRSILVLTPE